MKWSCCLNYFGFSEGSVLIFVTRKLDSEEVARKLRLNDFKLGLIHGDMHQSERNDVISAFKKNETIILVATDVAGEEFPSACFNIYRVILMSVSLTVAVLLR